MKVSKRKVLKLAAALSLLLMMYLALNKFHNTRCDSIDIVIKDSLEAHFVESNEVLDLIYSVIPNIQGYKMDSINIFVLKNKLQEHPFIRSVAIYKTISGKLKIDVVQRHPLVMVINNEGKSYYIDGDGIIFPTSDKYSSQVIVANGFIKDKFDFSNGKIYKADYKEGVSGKTTYDIFRLSQLILKDDFWRDQIEQIFVNSSGEYELVPMLGLQILSIGSMEDYDKKMYILKEFYFKGLRKTGWNTYSRISVKYKNQIVCKKRSANNNKDIL
ncbi:MAG: hypothetical protein IIU11_02755 [Bacteroidales bacterium]|jgi:cell division protein FtsQ|nr:hypothetical protein [Bacteroidales bacterium]MBR6278281.1 hypothetical protein [Bacteroidales bacterium]